MPCSFMLVVPNYNDHSHMMMPTLIRANMCCYLLQLFFPPLLSHYVGIFLCKQLLHCKFFLLHYVNSCRHFPHQQLLLGVMICSFVHTLFVLICVFVPFYNFLWGWVNIFHFFYSCTMLKKIWLYFQHLNFNIFSFCICLYCFTTFVFDVVFILLVYYLCLDYSCLCP
jgi:hypothetical protein